MSYPCPFCRTPADLATGCPGCGRGPDHDAAEVIRLDAEIPALTARLTAAQQAVAEVDAQLRDAWQRRDGAAARVRAAVAAAAAATRSLPNPAAGAAQPIGPTLPPAAAPHRTPEASTKLVQNVLFLLGGLLLGIAAIVFTAVAWTTFGVGGRAALLAGFTAVALAVPPPARRRSLTATAETFAALGLLLVLLDGYAAWYVDLFGIAGISGAGYAGAVFAVTAAIAVGYETVTGLTGPKFAALAAAQPVLPLLLAPTGPSTAGWALILAAVAALNLLVVHGHRDRPGAAARAMRVAGRVFGGVAAAVAVLYALIAVVLTGRLGEAAAGGAALIVVALVLVAAAVSARSTVAQAISGGLLVVATGIAAGRFAGLLGDSVLRDVVVDGSPGPALGALAVAVLAATVGGTARQLPAGVRRGPWVGA
ncbi:MAG TPA: hypothetical protein VFO77_09365, partial [Actinoplanes sp.]|nr:hypothetical protein [Actinoplanes sp.]